MPQLNLRRFASVGTLRAIDPPLLVRFLTPYAEFFEARGVSLALDEAGGLDYKGLAGVLMQPDEDTPYDLGEALYFIDELATAEGMEQLQGEAMFTAGGDPQPVRGRHPGGFCHPCLAGE